VHETVIPSVATSVQNPAKAGSHVEAALRAKAEAGSHVEAALRAKVEAGSREEAASHEPVLFPVFLKLAGRRVLVVGAGPVAASKIDGLTAAGAEIVVIAPEMVAGIEAAPVTRVRREFQDDDLDGAWLVVAAATPAVNRAVARAAERRGVFVNAVDDPPNASAYLGGVIRRAGVTLAISTNGHAPALAGLLREALDAVLPPDLDRWVAEARAIRRRWIEQRVPMAARRPQLLHALNAIYERRAWETYAAEVWL
jgi:uroporphyrin-III C-methyltransferase / precorrin-2 dehydrogenase / sirohydrochlorin ferrochelatase